MNNVRKSISIILVLSVLVASSFAANAEEHLAEPEQAIPVVDIDLGDYQAEMYIGNSQLLYPTVLPINATEQAIIFASSDTSVAIINMMGRITALTVGHTTITATAGGILRDFELRVVAIPVVLDIDLGDYQPEMQVGMSQVLMPTLLPLNVPEQSIVITSSNTDVATVNLMGRITARRVGRTTISVSSGGVTKEFILFVVEPPQVIRVTYIEVSNFKDEIAVGETVEISATPLPADAEEQRVTFSSGNPRIATVNSSGKIEGISVGTVTINIRADGYTKSMHLTVKEPTNSIDLNSSFVVLNVGDTFSLDIRVRPPEAAQEVTFKSYAPEIASVSESGVLTALQAGSASVLVSTWDASRVVNVIVNEAPPNATDQTEQEDEEKDLPPGSCDDLIGRLQLLPENGELLLDGELNPLIDAGVLRELFGTTRTITVKYPSYLLRIVGSDVKNANNELITRIELTEVDEGLMLLMNEGKPLPGRVSVELIGYSRFDFLYLYNDSSGRYELISGGIQGDTVIIVDYNGLYLVTATRISYSTVNWLIIGAIVIVLAVCGTISYIAVKKRHWFW